MRTLQVATAASYALIVASACLFRVSCADDLARAVLRRPELYGSRMTVEALDEIHPLHEPGLSRNVLAALAEILVRPGLFDAPLKDRALALLDTVAARELDETDTAALLRLVFGDERRPKAILDVLPAASRRAVAVAALPEFARRVRAGELPVRVALTFAALDGQIDPSARKLLPALVALAPSPVLSALAREVDSLDEPAVRAAARAVAKGLLGPTSDLTADPDVARAYLLAVVPGEHPSRALIADAFAALPPPALSRLSAELCRMVSGSINRTPSMAEEKVIEAAGDGLTPALYASALRVHARSTSWVPFRLKSMILPAARRPELRPAFEAFLAGLAEPDRAKAWTALASDIPLPFEDPNWVWLEGLARRAAGTVALDAVPTVFRWLDVASPESRVAAGQALLRFEQPGALADPSLRGADRRTLSGVWREYLLRFQPKRGADPEDLFRVMDRVTVQADARVVAAEWSARSSVLNGHLRVYLEKSRPGSEVWKAAVAAPAAPVVKPDPPAPRPETPPPPPPVLEPDLARAEALAERLLRELDKPSVGAAERRGIALQAVPIARHLKSPLDRARLVSGAGPAAVRDLKIDAAALIAEMRALPPDETTRFWAGLGWMETDPESLRAAPEGDWAAVLGDPRARDELLFRILLASLRLRPLPISFFEAVAKGRKLEGGGGALYRRLLLPAEGPIQRFRRFEELLGARGEGDVDVLRILLGEIVAVAKAETPNPKAPLAIGTLSTVGQRRSPGPEFQADLIRAFAAVPPGHAALRGQIYDAVADAGTSRSTSFLIDNFAARGKVPPRVIERLAEWTSIGKPSPTADDLRSWLEKNRSTLKGQIR